MRYTGGLLLRVFTKEGRLRAAVAFGRVNGGSLDSQYVLGPSLRGTSFRTMRWSVSGGHRATQDMTCEACR